METSRKRIIDFIENQGIKPSVFLEKTGLKKGFIDRSHQDSGATDLYLSKILDVFPELDPEWLLTGKGNMLKSERDQEQTPNEKGIPLIPVEAMAGFGTGSEQVMHYDSHLYVVPEFDELKVDFMIRVKGSSMQPKYNSGDLVACKRLALNDLFFQWNKVYVLDTDQGALVKRIKKGTNKDHILIVSDNENYDSFELHLKKIYSVAIVVGVIRFE
ncbi:S24 family peptidase [Flavobacterium sp.]|uniref:S24 family peptidase n=1 Tax=Flavobacterium sp. TaxID=239 RepID=UPI00260FA8BA|nr:S24 family peptidase [Flavobacterium sp.]MDD3005858.1 S24 family peptidase [Flavobacterium sp.]